MGVNRWLDDHGRMAAVTPEAGARRALPLRLARVVIMLLAAWCMVRDGPRFVALGSCCVVRHTCAGKSEEAGLVLGESLANRSGPRHS